jgi:uncharacterized LabA/DUF88 family protein
MIQIQPRLNKLAVLIEADNVPPACAEQLFSEIAKYGTATVKRAYGDWTTSKLMGWKNILNQFLIQPIQQFRYTAGKTATDIAMVIDAMDLLYSGKLDGICLVSSDSDFSRLATRLRESHLTVYGFGEPKTPQPFVVACDKFIKILPNHPFSKQKTSPIEKPSQPKTTNKLKCDTQLVNLSKIPSNPPFSKEAAPIEKPSQPKTTNKLKCDTQLVNFSKIPSNPPFSKETAPIEKPSQPKTTNELKCDTQLVNLLRSAVKAAADDEGWACLGHILQIVHQQASTFNLNKYGYKTLQELIKATQLFEIKDYHYVRDKRGYKG